MNVKKGHKPDDEAQSARFAETVRELQTQGAIDDDAAKNFDSAVKAMLKPVSKIPPVSGKDKRRR